MRDEKKLPEPTAEQSFHSIALSLIGIHKKPRETRRVQKDALRFQKGEARSLMRIPVRSRKRTVWDWLRDQFRRPQPVMGGGTGSF